MENLPVKKQQEIVESKDPNLHTIAFHKENGDSVDFTLSLNDKDTAVLRKLLQRLTQLS